MSKKSFGKSLVFSFLSITVTIAMLIGVTYAVFNDDASTNINIIRTGSLDIDIEDADGESILDRGIMIASDSSPWEPGRWTSTETFYIKNTGDLDLKFKCSVSAQNEDARMFDWRIVYEGSETTGESDENFNPLDELYSFTSNEYSIPASSEAIPAHLEGTIRDDASNDLMGKSVDGIVFTVHAKQTTEQAQYSYEPINPYEP